jgi:hypothetical protein
VLRLQKTTILQIVHRVELQSVSFGQEFCVVFAVFMAMMMMMVMSFGASS